MCYLNGVQGYNTKEVAKLMDMSAAQVLGYVRAGFLSPQRVRKREYCFGFQDLVLLRTAKSLIHARIAPRQVRRALQALRKQLPADRSLSGIRVTTEGSHIMVRDGEASWLPESGQILFDFDVQHEEPSEQEYFNEPSNEARANECFLIAVELEVEEPDEAKLGYLKTLELDPSHVGARINLGRLYHEDNAIDEAIRHYRQVLGYDPQHAIAAYNLGVAYEDLNQSMKAMEAYELAIAADPSIEDAHYNLGRLYELHGQKTQALRHMAAYRALCSK